MDRRDFMGCSASSVVASVVASGPTLGHALAADAKPKRYAKAILVDVQGRAIKAALLKPRTNYVFHYPFEGTPVFLLDLAQSIQPHALKTRDQQPYTWPGGVGPRASVVAFSAIYAHKLVYPTKQLSFISFRPGKAQRPDQHGSQPNLIHCCADHSQYDPAQGARVEKGPANQPLCAILLTHDQANDTLTAHATLGGELFNEFFDKYAAKLSLDLGPSARQASHGKSTVTELSQFCKNTVAC